MDGCGALGFSLSDPPSRLCRSVKCVESSKHRRTKSRRRRQAQGLLCPRRRRPAPRFPSLNELYCLLVTRAPCCAAGAPHVCSHGTVSRVLNSTAGLMYSSG